MSDVVYVVKIRDPLGVQKAFLDGILSIHKKQVDAEREAEWFNENRLYYIFYVERWGVK